MARTWNELVPGTLWTSDLEGERQEANGGIVVAMEKNNLAKVDEVVLAYPQHRIAIAKDKNSGVLVQVVAAADGTVNLFRGLPA